MTTTTQGQPLVAAVTATASSTTNAGSTPWLRPLEAVYSVAFLFFLVGYLTSVVISSLLAFPALSTLEEWSQFAAVLLLATFFTLQLLRMYSHLHDFDEGQALGRKAKKPAHFLQLLPVKYSVSERTLRLLFACLLVLSTKLSFGQESLLSVPPLRVAPAAQPSEPLIIPEGGITMVPAATLLLCFVLLIAWDVIVWRGLAANHAQIQSQSNAWRSARRFYYLPAGCTPGTGAYTRQYKFYERLAGLSAALTAFVYFIRPVPVFLIAFAFASAGILFFAVFGKLRVSKTASLPSIGDTALYLPVKALFTLYDYLTEGTASMHARRPRQQLLFAWIGLFLLVSLSFAVARCNRADAPVTTSTAQAPKRVRIVTSKNLWCTVTLVADAKGFFRAEGLDPVVQYQAAGRLNMDALLGGAADIANVVETNVAYQAMNATPNLAVLHKVVTARDCVALTRAGRGIAVPEDLRGKHIAFAQATGAESFLFWLLENAGIQPAQVSLLPVQPAGIVDQFADAGTDAVVTWEPFATTIRRRYSAQGPSFGGAPTDFAGIMFVASRKDWVKENSDGLARFDRAMKRAAEYVNGHPTEAQAIVAEAAGLPLSTVQSIWDRFEFGYSRPTEGDLRLVRDVVRRVPMFYPARAPRQGIDPGTYFDRP